MDTSMMLDLAQNSPLEVDIPTLTITVEKTKHTYTIQNKIIGPLPLR